MIARHGIVNPRLSRSSRPNPVSGAGFTSRVSMGSVCSCNHGFGTNLRLSRSDLACHPVLRFNYYTLL